MFELSNLSDPVVIAVSVLVGVLLLVAGRHVFWLAVAAAGFIFALGLASEFIEQQSGWIAIAVSVGVGVLGALIALFLQRVAIGIAGFLIVGYLVVWLLGIFEVDLGAGEWLAFVGGGIFGLLVAASLFEAALIGLSSLIGATMISQVIPGPAWVAPVTLVVLFVVGLLIQSRGLADGRKRR